MTENKLFKVYFILGVISIIFYFFIKIKFNIPKEKYIYFNDSINYNIIGKIDRLKHYKKSSKITGYYIGVNTMPSYMFRIHKKDTLNFSKISVSSLMNFGDSIYKIQGSNKVIIFQNNKSLTFYLEE